MSCYTMYDTKFWVTKHGISDSNEVHESAIIVGTVSKMQFIALFTGVSSK